MVCCLQAFCRWSVIAVTAGFVVACGRTGDTGCFSVNCDPDDDAGALRDGPIVGDECTVGIGHCLGHGHIVSDGQSRGGTRCDAVAGTPSPETCDGIDNDCDGAIDNGFPVGAKCAVGLGWCRREAVEICRADGSGTVCDATPGPPFPEEHCNGLDDDCDGIVDNGNPDSLPVTTGCIERTDCIDGKLQKRGAWASPIGKPGNPGTQDAPLASISAAIAQGLALPGKGDVFVCAQVDGESPMVEDVTMVEGLSLVGGFPCGRPAAVASTSLKTVSRLGLQIPSGITSQTRLEKLGVTAADAPGGTSVGITIVDASPQVTGVLAIGGAANESWGIGIRQTGAGQASPELTNVTARVRAAGTLIGGIRIEGASATLTATDVYLQSGAQFAIGLYCADCANTIVRRPGIVMDGGDIRATGILGTGNLDGVRFGDDANFGTVHIRGAGDPSGVLLENCSGSPVVTLPDVVINAPRGKGVAFKATGPNCRALFKSSWADVRDDYFYTEESTAYECEGSPCDLAGSYTSPSIRGNHAYGLRCLQGGCNSITGSVFGVEALDSPTLPTRSIGVEVQGGAPKFDRIQVYQGGCASAGFAAAMLLEDSGAVVTNSILRGCGEMIRIAGPGYQSPTVENNLIDGGGNAARPFVGVGISGNSFVNPIKMGVVRNNIIWARLSTAGSAAIMEWNKLMSFSALENNAFDLGVARLYVDEGSTSLTVAEMNALPGAGSNFLATCTNGSQLLSGTACIDSGTPTGAPDHDLDGRARPVGAAVDVGPWEFGP